MFSFIIDFVRPDKLDGKANKEYEIGTDYQFYCKHNCRPYLCFIMYMAICSDQLHSKVIQCRKGHIISSQNTEKVSSLYATNNVGQMNILTYFNLKNILTVIKASYTMEIIERERNQYKLSVISIDRNLSLDLFLFHSPISTFIFEINFLMSVFEGFKALESMFANVIKLFCFIVVSCTLFIGIQ